MTACIGKAEKGITFEKYGIYRVTETGTGVSFTARFSEQQRELCFHAPAAISGLTATSTGGGEFSLSYEGIKVSVGSFAVKTADDFFAALELLDEAGAVTDHTLKAVVDGISASAYFENGIIAELDFYDGLNNRNYKITTEATGWTTVQKQG